MAEPTAGTTEAPTEAKPATWATPASPWDVEYDGRRQVVREQWSPDDPTVARIDLGDFVLPQAKGPWVEKYNAIAKAGGLQAMVNVSGSHIRADLWQQRAPTPELRNLWLRQVGWPSAKATTWWEEAGGDASKEPEFNPKVKGEPAQIDHIVELQLGGTNVPENLAPHSRKDNEASGREIWKAMRAAAQDATTQIARRPGGKKLTSLTLYFSGATQPVAYEAPALAPLPKTGDVDAAAKARKGKASNGLGVHFTALADRQAGTRPSADDLSKAQAAVAALDDYAIAAGPTTATLKVPTKAAKADLIEGSEVKQNDDARELISGLVLAKLDRKKTPHYVEAWLNSPDHPARSGSRIPVLIKDQKSQQVDLKVEKGGVLRLAQENRRLNFTYPYLSAGWLALSSDATGVVTGKGEITPSVPLLSRTRIKVDWDKEGFRGSLDAPTDKISLPPFKVTEAAITAQLAPTLAAGGHVNFALGTIATGKLDASVDSTGFMAKGDIAATIPHLDSATGHIEYRPANGLSGFVEASASKPGGLVRSGQVRLDFTDKSWKASGKVALDLPGGSSAELGVHSTATGLLYTGKGTIVVPGLHPVDVDLQYDGEHLAGTAATTFSLLGADGDIKLKYWDGHFSGKGSAKLQKGKFSGELEAELHPDGLITGAGKGSVEIRPGMVGSIGIEYGRDKRLKTTGELTFPTYRFLEPRGNTYQLFQKSLPPIPIFAIPLGIGSVGLVATIGGGLSAHYKFGPGEIRGMVIRATLYPLEDDMQATLSAEATLVLPAEAGLELSLRAGIGASVVFATASGGITVTGGVVLRGGLEAGAKLQYGKGILVFDTQAKISVQPVLTLKLEADLMIEASVGGPWRWPWTLAAYEYPTGLEFGLIAPFHYQSDQPLKLPSISDIQWIVPQIDVGALADQVAGKVRQGIGI
ncbi:MAG: hypothetical protein NVS3B1_23100 [Marmoricola sp.]